MNGLIAYTGDSATLVNVEHVNVGYLPNARSGEGRSPEYYLPVQKSGTAVSAARVAPERPRDLPLPERHASRLPEQRYAIRAFCRRAVDVSDQMSSAAAQNDHMELAKLGISLSENLRELWKRRSLREEPWAEILNLLQGALTSTSFEGLRTEQCEAISKVVNSYLGGGTVVEEDVSRARRELARVALDPWRGISAPDPNA